ncbi:DUF3047 domain-containing protein [Vibrio sp. WJH972]
MNHYASRLGLVTWLFVTQVNANNLTHFGDTKVDEWQTKSFVSETQYSLVEKDHETVLKAQSKASASGIIFEEKIDLLETPYINWRWLVEKKLGQINETSKEGDDFAARVYVVIDGGVFFWNTIALSYVWSSNQRQGTAWDNPFAGKAVKMMATQGKQAQQNKWISEKHNVYEDLISQFGDLGSEPANLKKYRYIDATVIMTDTDNSGGEAIAYYGDIEFTAD